MSLSLSFCLSVLNIHGVWYLCYLIIRKPNKLFMLLTVFEGFANYFLILDTLLATDELKKLVNDIFSSLGGNATEQACETECHTLIQQDHLLQFGCPLVCKR